MCTTGQTTSIITWGTIVQIWTQGGWGGVLGFVLNQDKSENDLTLNNLNMILETKRDTKD